MILQPRTVFFSHPLSADNLTLYWWTVNKTSWGKHRIKMLPACSLWSRITQCLCSLGCYKLIQLLKQTSLYLLSHSLIRIIVLNLKCFDRRSPIKWSVTHPWMFFHRRPKLSLWGASFFKKSLCERSARETSYRDIVTAVIYCYITTLRETWLWPFSMWTCYVTTVWIYKGLYGGRH